MPMRNELSRAALVLASLLLGCVGELGEVPAPGPVDAAVPDADLVPTERTIELAGTDALALGDARCVDLADGERLLDVAPEGDAWLATRGGLRVLAPSGDADVRVTLRAGTPDRAIALSGDAAVAFAAGHLFSVAGGEVVPVSLPGELGAAEQACGDPRTDRAPFFVITPDGLHAREAGVWARWTAEGSSLVAMGSLAQESGACADASDELWVRDDEGAVRVRQDATAMTRVPELEGASELVREGAIVAARSSGAMVLRAGEGAPFETLRFDLGDVSAIAIGGGSVWAIAGGELIRRAADGAWSRIEMSLPSTDAIAADETGGAWLVSGARACRVAEAAALRVRGLRPHEVVFGDRPITLEADVAGASLELRVDGEVVFAADASDADHRWATTSLPLGGPGWHRLDALASLDGAEVRRALAYRVVDDTPLSWEADIRPDFESACAECHGAAGPRTNLASVEVYRAFARTIRDRMALGEMPPTGGPVSPAVVERMSRWIEGGMQP